MLLKVNPKTREATRVRGERLRDFQLNERDLQGILFGLLDQLIPDDELLLIMQSRLRQEEPDLMAVDKDGSLYIFELKAWESQSENLLQALRYGQIFGGHTYENLAHLYLKFKPESEGLDKDHEAQFDVKLNTANFNRKQVFVVMTNGLDSKTREAIQYWRKCGLDVRPWVYRIYRGNNEMLLEVSPFAVNDNPYSDLAEEGFYIVNTNYRHDPANHEDMLKNRKAAAYSDPWKFKIERLKKGDVVFLYQSGKGIIAMGKASGKLEKRPHHGHPDEEYAMSLTQFVKLQNPITAASVKDVTGFNYRFMSTMFALDATSGKKLYKYAMSQVAGKK